MTRQNKLNRLSKMTAVILTVATIANTAFFIRPTKAGSTATATANATAVVLASIALTKNRDLNFGNGAPGDGAKIVAANDANNSATFTVNGTANAAYSITVPVSTLNLVSGANTISVNNFVSSLGTSGTIGAGGSQQFSVGATRAALSATQALGTYTGTFNVTVTYQ